MEFASSLAFLEQLISNVKKAQQQYAHFSQEEVD